MKKWLIGLLLFWCNIIQAQDIITHEISDDGFVQVPLQFAFPYYGQLFTNSWMFSNGTVGFYSPFNGYTGGQNYFPQQFNPQMGNQYSFMIAPLWADLINISGSFTTQGDNTFQRYSWNDISQWGHPDNLNTFSLEIFPSGQISVQYDKVNISGSAVSVGKTGNLQSSEFEQVFYAPPGSNTQDISNWYVEGDSCLIDVLSSPSCPGYEEAYFAQQCSLDPLYNSECLGYEEAYFLANLVDENNDATNEESSILQTEIVTETIEIIETIETVETVETPAEETELTEKPTLNTAAKLALALNSTAGPVTTTLSTQGASIAINQQVDNNQNNDMNDVTDITETNNTLSTENNLTEELTSELEQLLINTTLAEPENINQLINNNEEAQSDQEVTPFVVSTTQQLVNNTVLSSNNVFSNNNMQQVLALGGTITEILNTPIPDFTKFDVKPLTQEEQIQSTKIENYLETMNQEDIEAQAGQYLGSMDPKAQNIAIQLLGYKAGFNQYDKTLDDQNNWYQQQVNVYNNNKLPKGSNLLFGAQDQRYQEIISLQYRR